MTRNPFPDDSWHARVFAARETYIKTPYEIPDSASMRSGKNAGLAQWFKENPCPKPRPGLLSLGTAAHQGLLDEANKISREQAEAVILASGVGDEVTVPKGAKTLEGSLFIGMVVRVSSELDPEEIVIAPGATAASKSPEERLMRAREANRIEKLKRDKY